MASIKISDLTSTETLTRDDVIPVVNGGDTKKVSIGNLSKNLAEFGEIGFKPVVVDTLPTENINTNTIYLTPSEDPDETNTYDEWIYSNEKWEKIGTTGVDLTEYYTKTEINDRLDDLEMLNYHIQVTDLYTNSAGNDIMSKLTDEDLQKFTDFINYLTTRENVCVNLYLSGKKGGSTSGTALPPIKQIYVFNWFNGSNSSTGSPIKLYGTCALSDFDTYSTGYNGFGIAGSVFMEIIGTWSNGIFTCTRVNLHAKSYRFLKADNSAADNNAFTHIPTGRSQAVHKEYVDRYVENKMDTIMSNNLIDWSSITYEDIVNNTVTGSSTMLTNNYVIPLKTISNYMGSYVYVSTNYLNDYSPYNNGTMQVYLSNGYHYGSISGSSSSMRPVADYSLETGFDNGYIGSIYASGANPEWTLYLIVSKTTTQEQFEELQQNSTVMVNYGSTALPYEPYYGINDIATKDYVNDSIANIPINDEEPVVYTLEFSGNYTSSSQYQTTDDDKILISELITLLKDDANVPIYVKFKGNGYAMLFTPFYGIKSGQQTSYGYQYIKWNNTNLRELWLISLSINGTWENDVFTISSAFISTDTHGFLSTGNQYAINNGFNPTLDQHPATKKYVDDAISTAITDALGGEY